MKRITELNACQCRWPVAEDEDGHFFCAAYMQDGPYCADHSPLAVRPTTQWVDRSAGKRADGRVKGFKERMNDVLVPPVDRLIASPVLRRYEAVVGVHEPA